MNARRAKAVDPIYKLKVSESGGQCQATTGEWGMPESRRCPRIMDGVFIDDMGRYVVLCRECRIMALGYTSSERKAMRDKFRGSQVPLFENASNVKKDYSND